MLMKCRTKDACSFMYGDYPTSCISIAFGKGKHFSFKEKEKYYILYGTSVTINIRKDEFEHYFEVIY